MSGTTPKKYNVFWLRRDLRLEDNVGLFRCLEQDLPVLVLFIFDKSILKKLKNQEDKRVQFIYDSLLEIKRQLNKLGSDLVVLNDSVKMAWQFLLEEYQVANVYCNEDYEPYAIKRDSDIKKILHKNGVKFFSFKDQCVFAKNDILKKDGKPYTVYTPYKKRWLERVTPGDIGSYKINKYLNRFAKIKNLPFPKYTTLGFNYDESFKKKRTISKKLISDYHLTRDFPAQKTSMLGLHLRFGTISVRKCVQIAYHLNDTWLSELIWREFFMQILYHFPNVTHEAFKEKYRDIKWDNNKSLFRKWCEGRTGYPMVDAGMRELNATGFMHNRVRMVAASFLVKDLLIDWRWGEKYFAEKLLDFDLSANNGNWQWVAGTGCDAAPYFRIFNPATQVKKFDSELKYIKKWIPEYGTEKYHKPIVDHKFAYERALYTYKVSINSAT